MAGPRIDLGRFVAGLACIASATALALAGCGSDEGGEPELTIHLGPPLAGPAWVGEDFLDGARLALSEAGNEAGGVAVSLEVADPGPRGQAWKQAGAAAAARAATEDASAIAYVNAPGGVAPISAPITNEAGILEIVAGAVPERVVRERPGGDSVPREYQPSGERTLGALALAGAPLPGPSADAPMPAAYRTAYGRPPTAAAIYSYEATALALDAIDRAADPLDRGEVVEAFLETAGRDSLLGRYTIDPVGIAVFE
jgi:hypothetical protein